MWRALSGTHYIAFYCDDIQRTLGELKARGVKFTDDIKDFGYGLATHFRMTGMDLYKPRYKTHCENGAIPDGLERITRKQSSPVHQKL